jgi:hypothetical protein
VPLMGLCENRKFFPAWICSNVKATIGIGVAGAKCPEMPQLTRKA